MKLEPIEVESQTTALAVRPVNVEQLLIAAVERGVPVETMERLMVMRRELRAESAKEAFDRALAAFQAECPTIQKTKKVMNKGGSGVRYCYAPLETIIHQVKDLLQRHGFCYTLDAQVEAGWVTATCKATHSLGHCETSSFKVPIEKDAFMNEAQKFASALTFTKRYAFCNAFGILTGDEDDDSNSSHSERPRQQEFSGHQNKPNPQSPAQPEPRSSSGLPSGNDEKRINELLEASKAKLIQSIGNRLPQLWCHGRRCGWLMPNERLEMASAHLFFPVAAKITHYEKAAKGIKGDYDKLMAEVLKLQPTNDEQRAFDACYGPPGTSTDEPQRPPKAQQERDVDSSDAPWRAFPMPFGAQAGKPLGKVDKKYLFGLWANFEVEETYEKDGEQRRRPKDKIDRDRQLRAFLDDAGAHYKFTLPEDRDKNTERAVEAIREGAELPPEDPPF